MTGWGRSLLTAIDRSIEGARLSRSRSPVRAGRVVGVTIAEASPDRAKGRNS